MPMFDGSDIQSEILRLLIGKEGMYGGDMVKASEKLKRATIYVHLSRLEDREWIRSVSEQVPGVPDMLRRRYFITDEGRKAHDKVRF